MTAARDERRQASSAEAMHRLVERYCAGEMTAEDYYAAMDAYARRAIRAQMTAAPTGPEPRTDAAVGR